MIGRKSVPSARLSASVPISRYRYYMDDVTEVPVIPWKGARIFPK